MDGYIKKSEAVDVIVKYPYEIAGKTATAIKMIEDLPSADVVPKSEVDEMLIGKANSLTAKFVLEDHKAHIKALMAEHDSKLASEIFAEIEFDICQLDFDREETRAIAIEGIIAKAKKKYTECEPIPASVEKYFSPEDVSKMTPQEIREKYTAIRRSMERW